MRMKKKKKNKKNRNKNKNREEKKRKEDEPCISGEFNFRQQGKKKGSATRVLL